LEGELLQILEAFGGTTLYVSHNRDEVYRLCRKVCVINEGHNENVRTVEALFESPNTLASCLLSGCKNYSRAEKLGVRVLRAIDWGVDLVCGADISDDLRYVGVRAHHVAFYDKADNREENVFACRVLRVIQDVFSTIVNLQPLNAASENERDYSRFSRFSRFSRIRMELSKQEGVFQCGDAVTVKIRPENIMLLKK
jgi:molybdate transport system ATP-binding protein